MAPSHLGELRCLSLDHETNHGAEATLLTDPDRRCIDYDAVASVFVSRGRGLEASFPTVDFAARHFRDPAWRAPPPVPRGLAEAESLLALGSAIRNRPGATRWLRLALALPAGDRLLQAIELDPTSAARWARLGSACWDLAPDPTVPSPRPDEPWEPAGGCRAGRDPRRRRLSCRALPAIRPAVDVRHRGRRNGGAAARSPPGRAGAFGRPPGHRPCERGRDHADPRPIRVARRRSARRPRHRRGPGPRRRRGSTDRCPRPRDARRRARRGRGRAGRTGDPLGRADPTRPGRPPTASRGVAAVSGGGRRPGGHQLLRRRRRPGGGPARFPGAATPRRHHPRRPGRPTPPAIAPIRVE